MLLHLGNNSELSLDQEPHFVDWRSSVHFSAVAVHLIVAYRSWLWGGRGQGEVKFIHSVRETVCPVSLAFRHMQYRRHPSSSKKKKTTQTPAISWSISEGWIPPGRVSARTAITGGPLDGSPLAPGVSPTWKKRAWAVI